MILVWVLQLSLRLSAGIFSSAPDAVDSVHVYEYYKTMFNTSSFLSECSYQYLNTLLGFKCFQHYISLICHISLLENSLEQYGPSIGPYYPEATFYKKLLKTK